MADEFKPGDVIWVKCGQLFWPAKVLSVDDLPEDVKEDLAAETKQPKIIAKFFDEEGYEFLHDTKNVHPYNCPKKEDFIKKGVAKGRALLKQGAKKDDGWFSKFPKDVVKSEELTGGDTKILEKEPYVEKVEQKIDYKEIFGGEDNKKKGKKGKHDTNSPSPVKGGRKRSSTAASPSVQSPSKRGRRDASPQRPIVHPRFRAGGGGSDHQVKIMHQPSTPYHLDLQKKEEAKQKGSASGVTTAGGSGSTPSYTCHICGFTATRLNVVLMCQKNCQAKGRSSLTSTPRGTSLASPSRRPAMASSPTGKASPISRRKTEPPAKSSPKTTTAKTTTLKATPKKKVADVPAPTAKNKAVDAAEEAAKKPSATPSSVAAPVRGKKQRMTKKMKIEQEKKKEERKNILDEWGDDEEDESEEKKKINETLGRSSEDGSDDEGSVHGEGVFGDDNVHGYDDDDDDVEMEKSADEKPKTTDDKHSSPDEKTKDDTTAASVVELTEPAAAVAADEKAEETPKKAAEEDNDQLLSDDIGKLLEETKVPDLPSEILDAKSSSNNKPKKSIKFSESLTKELQQKKMQLVQANSNLDIPDEVEDEFAESSVDIPEPGASAAPAAKPILKNSTQNTTDKTVEAQEELKDDSVQKELERKSKEETVSSLLALQAGNVAAPADVPEQATVAAEPVVMQEVVAASQPAVVSAAAAVLPTATAVAPAVMPAVASAAAPTSEHQEETYILLVDENSQVDPSQVLYLDPNSLASGNVLLMSQDSNGTATPTAAVAQQPSVVTTVANGSQNGTTPTQLQVVKEQQPQLLVQQPVEVPAQQIEQQQQQVLAAVVPSE